MTRKGSGSLAWLRERNRERVMQSLRDHGRMSQASIARTTGLSRTTVSSLVGELKDAGLIGPVDDDGAAPKRGRRGVQLALQPSATAVLGLDFGHSHVRVAVADLAHNVLAERMVDLDVSHRAREALDLAVRMVDEALAEVGMDRKHAAGAGVGIPGPVDRTRGMVGSTTIMPGWVGIPIASELESRLHLPVGIENDANLGALAELAWGAGRNCANVAYIKAATGIGAGIVIDGQLVRGAFGTAGEIGHNTLDENGALCYCGNRGCLETVASGPAIIQLVSNERSENLTLPRVIDRALDGDVRCRRAISDAGREIGVAVAGLCNLVNPERVIVGGMLSRAGDILLEPIRESIRRFAVHSAAERTEVVGAAFTERAELLGSVALALTGLEKRTAAAAHDGVAPVHKMAAEATRPVVLSATRDLGELRAPGIGVFASGDVLFSNAVFGRDSATVAQTLLHIKPEIARDVIVTLSRLQGVVEAPVGPQTNEEEPGKIVHEHRTLFVGTRRISPSSERLLQVLSRQWGGDESGLTYYGSVDATPLYVRLVIDYCAAHGEDILAKTVTRRDGRTVTIRECLYAAVDWITRRMDSSDLGFIEFWRRNPDGIQFQVWKDSGTSYVHADGSLANWDAPIAAIEVQAYAYDALLAAGRLFGRQDWRERAAALRQRVIERMWIQESSYFAMGLDRDATGRPRRIESIASNGALVLDTGLLEGLPDAELYTSGAVRRICSADFVTDVGVRCRTVGEAGLVGFQDYHGTWTVWPKETFEIARGLARQGMPHLARQLGNRLLNAVNVAGANVEFLYVSPDGRVMYDFRGVDPRDGDPRQILGTNRPEAPAAWTVAAALALKAWYGNDRPLLVNRSPREEWRARLESEVSAALSQVGVLGKRAGIEAAYARRGDFALNLAQGRERDRRARVTRRGSELEVGARP